MFGDGVRPLRFEEALFDVMLAGWVRQQRARLLSAGTIGPRARLVRRLQTHAGTWPWEWRAEQLEEWIEDLSLPRPLRSIGTKSHDKDRAGDRRGLGKVSVATSGRVEQLGDVGDGCGAGADVAHRGAGRLGVPLRKAAPTDK